MNGKEKKRYTLTYTHDEDPDIRKTFSIEATNATEAANAVDTYIDTHSLHSPKGEKNYTIRVRKLRIRDAIDYEIS